MSFAVGTGILCLALALLIASKSYAEDIRPRTINITVLNSETNNQCPSTEQRERGINDIQNEVRSILSEYQQLYDCKGTQGWRRVVYINMTDTSFNCPPGLNLTSYSKRTCGRAHSDMQNCSSTTFSVGGYEYSQVCGKIRGYQVGGTLAFHGHYAASASIDGSYVDGVSLTHGADGGRHHIWTFAVELTEVGYSNPINLCPCGRSTVSSPPFVGNDYFCESGLHSAWSGGGFNGIFFPDDPLWDGQDCESTSTCCQFNTPPWFSKNLSNPTTDDIEFRICLTNSIETTGSDVLVDLIELYIK